jgi:acetylornithine deacetylase/succinyl-diaminopimelate desuccinylase-like protein
MMNPSLNAALPPDHAHDTDRHLPFRKVLSQDGPVGPDAAMAGESPMIQAWGSGDSIKESASLAGCCDPMMAAPAASHRYSEIEDPDGIVMVSLGAKGIVELELVSSGEAWGRGPAKDIHSSLKAMVDSPVWHLIKALNTLVSEDGNTITIDNYPTPRPVSAEERAMIAEASQQRSEEKAKKLLSVRHWIDDLPWVEANERLESQPTVNIEGLVGGYTGPGGKTILPHRAVAKLDLRLVPDMTKDDAVAALKKHLAAHGYGDLEVNVTGGYDPTSTAASAPLIQAQIAVLARTPAMCLPVHRSSSPRDTSGSATAAALTRRTSTT